MLTADAQADLAKWNAAKLAQWEALASAMPGLQLVRYGPARSTFMLICSRADFYEGVVIGQLPQRVPVAGIAARRRRPVDSANDQKPIDARAIDLTDDQVNAILALWENGRSALPLFFVSGVCGRDGVLRPKPLA